MGYSPRPQSYWSNEDKDRGPYRYLYSVSGGLETHKNKTKQNKTENTGSGLTVQFDSRPTVPLLWGEWGTPEDKGREESFIYKYVI